MPRVFRQGTTVRSPGLDRTPAYGPMLKALIAFAETQRLPSWGRSPGTLAVRIRGRLTPAEGQLGGLFEKTDGDLALIAIFRNHQSIPIDSRLDLMTLAHEFGHFVAWKRRERTPFYEGSLQAFHQGARLNVAQADAILREERRAWRHGYAALLAVGFKERRCYGHRTRRALQEYRRRLGLV